MDIARIQQEITKVCLSEFARKTDKQLLSYQELSDKYYLEKGTKQPKSLVKYNNPKNRKCKLTPQQVQEIREKYTPYVYGKKKLAAEYGVSASVIYRIIKGVSWKSAS